MDCIVAKSQSQLSDFHFTDWELKNTQLIAKVQMEGTQYY